MKSQFVYNFWRESSKFGFFRDFPYEKFVCYFWRENTKFELFCEIAREICLHFLKSDFSRQNFKIQIYSWNHKMFTFFSAKVKYLNFLVKFQYELIKFLARNLKFGDIPKKVCLQFWREISKFKIFWWKPHIKFLYNFLARNLKFKFSVQSLSL